MTICELPRWQHLKQTIRNLSFEKFIKFKEEDKDSICLDVRTPEEFKHGHIPGALNLNYLDYNLADQLEKLPRSKRYYVYCRSGRRSLRVCVLMRNMNLDIFNLGEGCRNRL